MAWDWVGWQGFDMGEFYHNVRVLYVHMYWTIIGRGNQSDMAELDLLCYSKYYYLSLFHKSRFQRGVCKE